jgi:hypothetical protein
MPASQALVTALAALAALGFSTFSCSSPGDLVTVNEAIFLQSTSGLVPRGSGCTRVHLPGSGGGSRPPTSSDFSFTEGPDGDAFRVDVFSNDDLLASRRYGESMLHSGRLDEFTVTTHSGANYLLRYWGGGPCAAPN